MIWSYLVSFAPLLQEFGIETSYPLLTFFLITHWILLVLLICAQVWGHPLEETVEATSLIKMDSSSHSSLQFPIALSYGWCLLSLSSIHARMLTGLTLYRQTHLLRVCGTIPEYTVFQQSSLIWAITVFLPSPPWFSLGIRDDINVPFEADNSTVTYPLHFDLLWFFVITFVHGSKKLFW